MNKRTPRYLRQLKTIAPNVAFSVSRSGDQSFRRDGDGPDPVRRGYYPYDVDVKAKAIVNGELIEGCASLGGSHYKQDEPLGNVHGYLPQMLEKAAAELRQRPGVQLLLADQLAAALALLKRVMREEYAKQVRNRW